MTAHSFVARMSRWVLAGAMILAVGGACKVTEPSPHTMALVELARHQDQWAKQDLRQYAFDYDMQAMVYLPPVRIFVVNGQVSEVVDRTSGIVLSTALGFPTVDSLFRIAARTLDNDSYETRIEYDPERGYPTRIEAGSPLADAGFSITAANLEGIFIANEKSPALLRSRR